MPIIKNTAIFFAVFRFCSVTGFWKKKAPFHKAKVPNIPNILPETYIKLALYAPSKRINIPYNKPKIIAGVKSVAVTAPNIISATKVFFLLLFITDQQILSMSDISAVI